MSIPATPFTVDDFVAGQIIEVPEYYTWDVSTGAYTDNNGDDLLDYSFADKVSVGGGSNTASYTVEVNLGSGGDDVLFFGAVDAGYVIPKAVALECAAFFYSQVIDLSAGPMSYGRYRQLGTAAESAGAYLLEMTGQAFAQDLAQMDTFKSIAMVDIASGTAVLENNIGIRSQYVEIAGGSISIDENLTYAGNMTIVEGAVHILANEIATYTGILNDTGKIGGAGTLEILHGEFSIGEGAGVNVQTWLSKGNSTEIAQDYIDSKLDFKGDYIVGEDVVTFFYKASSLEVKEIHNINGLGGTFDMTNWDPTYNGDDTIEVLGAVANGESFDIGTTDALILGDPLKFHGVVESMTVGSNATSTQKALAGGEVALVGIWNFVSATASADNTKTVVTMKDTADGLLAHIDFADLTSGTPLAASYFEFFDQLKGVTPTTVITPYVTPSVI